MSLLSGFAIEEEWEMDIRRFEGVSTSRVTSRVHSYFYHLDGSVVCEGHFLQHLTIRGGMEWGKTPSDACKVTLSKSGCTLQYALGLLH